MLENMVNAIPLHIFTSRVFIYLLTFSSNESPMRFFFFKLHSGDVKRLHGLPKITQELSCRDQQGRDQPPVTWRSKPVNNIQKQLISYQLNFQFTVHFCVPFLNLLFYYLTGYLSIAVTTTQFYCSSVCPTWAVWPSRRQEFYRH